MIQMCTCRDLKCATLHQRIINRHWTRGTSRRQKYSQHWWQTSGTVWDLFWVHLRAENDNSNKKNPSCILKRHDITKYNKLKWDLFVRKIAPHNKTSHILIEWRMNEVFGDFLLVRHRLLDETLLNRYTHNFVYTLIHQLKSPAASHCKKISVELNEFLWGNPASFVWTIKIQ